MTKDTIIRKEDLSKWPYLNKAQILVIGAKVVLLIGSNAPKVMEPWELINSQQNGPFAVRTHLEWVISGPLRGHDGTDITNYPTVLCNRISIPNIEELLICQYNQDSESDVLFERASGDKKKISVEDRKFMKCTNDSVILKDGHYNLDLFRKDILVMLNNWSVAEQGYSKRKFQRNEHFKLGHTDFLTDAIEKGYAEVIPQEQLEKTDGRLWYIPHHGGYHQTA